MQHVRKTTECIVSERLITFLQENYLPTHGYHTFRPGRRCLTELPQHFHGLLKHQLNKSALDVINLDFAKAFDNVDHGMRYHKLCSLGIGGKLGKSMHHFLIGRIQKVIANGAQIARTPFISGIPLDFVLGALIFVVSFSDMLSTVN